MENAAPATILLAEDDPNDAFFVARALSDSGLGHKLVTVSNGEDCIRYLRGQGRYADRTKYPYPGLVLLDIKMPIMTGIEVLKEMAADPVLSRTPAIIL